MNSKLIILWLSLIFSSYTYSQGVSNSTVPVADNSPHLPANDTSNSKINKVKDTLTPAQSYISWKAAAEKGDMTSQYNLGLVYEQGLGISVDLKKAAHWYKKASMQGHIVAAYNLATMAHQGHGVKPDLKMAMHWYEFAAKKGNLLAQASLGFLYATENTPFTDAKKAVYWFTRAAKLGHPEAQFNLGMMYSTGKGTELDYIKAYAWFNISGFNQYKNAIESRNFAAARLTVKQLELAKSLSNHYRELYFKSHIPK